MLKIDTRFMHVSHDLVVKNKLSLKGLMDSGRQSKKKRTNERKVHSVLVALDKVVTWCLV